MYPRRSADGSRLFADVLGRAREIIEPIAPIYLFPIIFGFSLLGCIAGTFLTRPDDMETLKEFYRKIRPWGFWGPVHEQVVAEHPEVQANTDFRRDMFNVTVGIVWQTALTATGIYLVLKDFESLAVALCLVAIASVILKYNWYDKIENHPSDTVSTSD